MGEESNRTQDVFLSYSSNDKTWADAACAVLERHRIRCWIAPRDITPGEEWAAGIMKGINGSRMMVLIFSGHANASDVVRCEVERAINRKMIILSTRIEDVRPEGGMELVLSNKHWLDAFTPPVERQFELLAQSVKTLLGRDGELPKGPRVPGDEPVKPEVKPLTKPTGPHRPRAFWLIAVAASLIGFVALGVIMIAITSRNGEPKNTVPSDSSNQVDGRGKLAEQNPSKNGPTRSANKTADSARSTTPVPNAAPTRIPPAGPARVAQINKGAWSVDGDQLVKEDLPVGTIRFGNVDGSDYDLTFEASKSAGTGGFGVSFRAGYGQQNWLRIGDLDKHSFGRVSSTGKRSEFRSSPGTIRLRDWYKVKITLRGPRIRIELDDHHLFQFTDNFSQKGAVMLRWFNSSGRFRNIKVTASDGTVLWEGPPDLPAK